MKTPTTRIPPNYVLIAIIIGSVLFWLGVIHVLFGQQIKDWFFSVLSSML